VDSLTGIHHDVTLAVSTDPNDVDLQPSVPAWWRRDVLRL